MTAICGSNKHLFHFGAGNEEIIREQNHLHDEELHGLCTYHQTLLGWS
jgi:hypothetical protein